jgi:hypothetical protein
MDKKNLDNRMIVQAYLFSDYIKNTIYHPNISIVPSAGSS